MQLTCETGSAIGHLLTSAVALVLATTFAEASVAEEDEARVSSSTERCETATAFDGLTNRSFELDPPSFGWRSQLASFPTVYWDETGVSSPLMPEEDTSSGLFAGVGSDCDTPLDLGEAGDLATHLDYLAPWLSAPESAATDRWLGTASPWDLRTQDCAMRPRVAARYPWLSPAQSCQLKSFLAPRFVGSPLPEQDWLRAAPCSRP